MSFHDIQMCGQLERFSCKQSPCGYSPGSWSTIKRAKMGVQKVPVLCCLPQHCTNEYNLELYPNQRIYYHPHYQLQYYSHSVFCHMSFIYVGLTTRELKKRVCEHVLGIRSARDEDDLLKLKTIPIHFKIQHESNPQGLKEWGIDRILLNQRGGNFAKLLAQRKAKWIYILDIVAPQGLNENLSFSSFLELITFLSFLHPLLFLLF